MFRDKAEIMRVLHPELGKQLDTWSCGHRVIVYVKNLLMRGFGLRHADGWTYSVDAFPWEKCAPTQESIDEICVPEPSPMSPAVRGRRVASPLSVGVGRAHQADIVGGDLASTLGAGPEIAPTAPQSEPAPSKAKSEPTTAPTAPSKAKSEPTTAPTAPSEAKIPKPTVAPTSAWNAKAANTHIKTEISKTTPVAKAMAVPSAAPKAKAAANQGLDDVEVPSSLGFADALDESLRQIAENRSRLQTTRRLLQRGKKILAECGFDFNTHFQKKHSCRLERGHWDRFLLAVGTDETEGEPVQVECSLCQELIRTFKVAPVREAFLEKERSKKRDAERPARSPDAEEAEPAVKKRKAGRPKKGESLEFNILNFIEEHRTGMYELLTEDQAGM